ncbi:MAG: EFR1 family ferrodoxin [Spirochaetales bacterium]|nr:EFR1 family ferrodoxin [Spirochaetales bacterium]
MKIKLIIFSGTGNTRFIAHKMKENFEKLDNKCEIVELDSLIKRENLNFEEDDILGFGYPVYDMKPPIILLDFIENNFLIKKTINAFVFSTYTSYPLDCNAHIIKLLNKININVIHEGNFKCPGASAYLYSNPENRFVKNSTVFEKNIDIKILKFVKKTLRQDNKPIKAKFNILNKVHQMFTKFLYRMLFYKNLKINNSCISCGLCVKKCPVGNIIKIENKIKINDPNGCLKCLRCIQSCPTKSINFTSSSRTGDYTNDNIIYQYKNSKNQSMLGEA